MPFNTHKSNEADKNALSTLASTWLEEQRKEHLHCQLNQPNPTIWQTTFYVNAGSLNAAQKVANAYQEDNWYVDQPWCHVTTRALANVGHLLVKT